MRLQRIPPTERSGRVHSSSVTVAVMGSAGSQGSKYDRSADAFDIQWFSGTGCGGQKRNKVKSSIRLRHIETGIVTTSQTRSRENSKNLAMVEISKRLDDLENSSASMAENSARQNQIGDGRRGNDRRRTFRFQDGQVTDSISGKTARTTDVMKGRIDLLWK